MSCGESQSLEVVTLRRIRYNDKRSVLTVWSRQHGRVSLVINDQGTGRTATRLRALTMPVSIVECRAVGRPDTDLLTASQFSVVTPLPGLHLHPVKGMIATFVAEVAYTMLRQNAPDDAIWYYLTGALQYLDAATSSAAIASFPAVFLFRLASVLGIAPDVGDYAPGKLLDVVAGRFGFSVSGDSRVLNREESRLIAMLGKLDFTNMDGAEWGRAERNSALDLMLGYFSLHMSTPVELKSTTVLRSIFDARPSAAVLDNGAIGVHKADTP